jgi:hypothetical protein
MVPTATIPNPSPDTTDLERRVLAHERILQSLIAFMSRTEPRFVDHLREKFVEPMAVTQHEHDYRDVDDYAEEFIRAVMLLGDKHAPEATPTLEGVKPASGTKEERTPTRHNRSVAEPDRVQLRERNGIWEVKVDGAFRGDYHRKEHAIAAAALARLSL